MNQHQTASLLTSLPSRPSGERSSMKSFNSIDYSSKRRSEHLPDSLAEEMLRGFYSDDETPDPADRPLSTLGSKRIKFMDSNIPEELMDGTPLPPSAADVLPPSRIADIRRALVDGDLPAPIVSYVIKAVSYRDFCIKTMAVELLDKKSSQRLTPSTAADLTDTDEDRGATDGRSSLTTRCRSSRRDDASSSRRSIARLSSKHSTARSTNSVTQVLHRIENNVNALRQRIGPPNGGPVDALLRDCQQDVMVLRQFPFNASMRDSVKPSGLHSVYRLPSPRPPVSQYTVGPSGTPYAPLRSSPRQPFLGKPAFPAQVFRAPPKDLRVHPPPSYKPRVISTLAVPPIVLKPHSRSMRWCCSSA